MNIKEKGMEQCWVGLFSFYVMFFIPSDKPI